MSSSTNISLGANKSFHLMWTSTFASGFGDRMVMLAILAMMGFGLNKGQNTGLEAQLQAKADFFFFLPYLLWTPIAGWISDRMSRRYLMFIADQLRGLLILGGLLIIPVGGIMGSGDLSGGTGGTGIAQPWLMWGLLLAVGVCAATFTPAKMSLVPNVVPPQSLMKANAVVVNMGIIGNLFGAMLSKQLLEPVNGTYTPEQIRLCVGLAAGAYIISGGFWLFVKAKQHYESHQLSFAEITRELGDGLSYTKNHRTVRTLIGIAALVWTATSLYMPALAMLSTEVYQGGVGTFGLLQASLGAGMLLGGILVAVLNIRVGYEFLLTGSVLGVGALMTIEIGVAQIAPWLSLGLLINFLIGICGGIVLITLNTLLQRTTADYLRGRVFGAKEFLAQIGKIGASLLIILLPITLLNDWIGPMVAIIGLILVVASWWGWRQFVLTGPLPSGMLNLLFRCCRFLTQTVHRLEVHGGHHLPRTGGGLIVANHRSGVDPLLIQTAIPRLIHWVMAKEYQLSSFNWLWRHIQPIGVDRSGGAQDSSALRQVIRQLKDQKLVGLFPEGQIPEEKEQADQHPIQLQPGAALMAQRGGQPIIPIWIEGTPKGDHVFGALYRFCHAKVWVGPPIIFEPKTKRDQVLAEITQAIESLKQQANHARIPPTGQVIPS